MTVASNTVRVNVVGDSSQLRTAFDQGATAGERFEARMGLLAKAVVAALAIKAVRAVKDFVGDSKRAYQDLQESVNAVEVVYGQHADAVLAMGRRSADALGVSNSAFNSWAVSMAAFAEQIAGSGGDVAGVVDEMSTRIADFASVMNLDFEEASRLFQSGLAGQSRPLRQFGIDVSAARVEQQALNDGIWDGNGAMTEGEKVIARYNTIMEQTERTAGDFARTSEDLANKGRRVEAQLENTKAVLGEKLAPAYLAALQATEGFIDGMLRLVGAIGKADEALQDFFASGEEVPNAVAMLTKLGEEPVDSVWTLIGGFFALNDSLEDSLKKTRFQRVAEGLELITSSGDLTTGQLAELRLQLDDAAADMGFTGTEAAALARILDTRLSHGVGSAGDIIAGNLVPALGDAIDELDDATEATKTFGEQQRMLHDPLFAAMRHFDNLQEATANYTQSLRDNGPKAQETIGFAKDMATEHSGLMHVLQKLKDDGIDPTGDAARAMFEGMGLDQRTIDAIFAQFEKIQRGMPILDLRVRAHSINFTQDGNTMRPGRGGAHVLGTGGIVTGPTMGLIGEAGDDEAVIPLNHQGIKILGAALREAMGSNGHNGGGGTVYVTVNALDPQSAANAVVQALQTYQRSNGAIPIEIR